ncbi:MAG: serine hydrolase, partial [Planctomycetes bacterium]|nr:serine hydrolase [Planctomycetota bacterium]
VRALLAGADVLLMPPDPLAARAAVVDAVKSGRVPMARLDDAVRRILRSKAQVGLLAGGGRLDPEWRQRVRTPGSQRLAHDIAARGITLVRDRGELLPVGSNWNDDAVYVAVFDRDDGADLGAVLPGLQQRHRVSAKSSAAEVAAAVAAVAGAERVVLSLHVKVRSYSGGIALPEAVRPVVDALTEAQEVVAISFGNPYLVADLPAIDTYLCAYVDTATTRQVANAMLRGERPIDGRLPVSIPGVAERGTGLRRYRDDITGPGGTPVEDVDPELPARLRERLERAVADHAFPGAVCLVARHGERVAELAVGRWTYDPASAPVELDTLYDLASLTKVTATTPAVLRLVADGVLSLDDPVQKWVPAFAGEGKAAVTIRHLLTHCGGLPAYVRFFRTLQGKDAIVAAAAQEGLMVEPGTRTIYSDLGFILLMAVVEAASERPFAEFAPSVIFPFAGIEAHPRFVPTDGWSAGAPPTEQDGWRGRLVSGYVHDENAYAMGGVSGHAGLFARAGDILTLGLDLLAGGRGKLPPAIVAAATRPAGLVPGDTTRGLGYQMLQPGSWAGTTLSPGAFGHTGFTGTSLWCDPELDACVVLLSNRVHPTRVNNKITAVRRDVHDLVRAAMR